MARKKIYFRLTCLTPHDSLGFVGSEKLEICLRSIELNTDLITRLMQFGTKVSEAKSPPEVAKLKVENSDLLTSLTKVGCDIPRLVDLYILSFSALDRKKLQRAITYFTDIHKPIFLIFKQL